MKSAIFSLLIPWALSNLDEAIEFVGPHLVRQYGVSEATIDLAVATLPAVVEGIQVIKATRPDLSSQEGVQVVLDEVRAMLDSADDLPMWADWTEAARDEFIDDLVGVARGVFRMIPASDKPVRRRGVRQLKRDLKRELVPRLRARLLEAA